MSYNEDIKDIIIYLKKLGIETISKNEKKELSKIIEGYSKEDIVVFKRELDMLFSINQSLVKTYGAVTVNNMLSFYKSTDADLLVKLYSVYENIKAKSKDEIEAKRNFRKVVLDIMNVNETINEMIPDWRELNDTSYKDIRMQTFGNFEVFVKNKPINFEREKAKELLAYLVDRHGASVTTREIASVLWEDIPYDIKLKNRVTTTVTSLKKSLRLYGIEEILIKSWNHLSIDVSKIKCDAYDFEKGDISAINSFHGEYLSNYSWSEFTTGKYVKIINEL